MLWSPTAAEELFLPSFESAEWIKEQSFSRIHKVLLDILPGDLATELDICSKEINSRDNHGSTPLIWAVDKAVRSPDGLTTLLHYRANVNTRDNMGWTPLHHAVRNAPNAIKTLLRHGADIDAKELHGCTPLSDALYSNNHKSLEVLLDHGADIGCVTPLWGGTPLHFVAETADARTMRILARARLQGLDVTATGRGFSAAEWFWEFRRRRGDDAPEDDVKNGFFDLLQSLDPGHRDVPSEYENLAASSTSLSSFSSVECFVDAPEEFEASTSRDNSVPNR